MADPRQKGRAAAAPGRVLVVLLGWLVLFALVGVVRLILVIDSRKHPEKYGMHAATVETIAMAGIEPGSKK